jgi:hypothetical protein
LQEATVIASKAVINRVFMIASFKKLIVCFVKERVIQIEVQSVRAERSIELISSVR